MYLLFSNTKVFQSKGIKLVLNLYFNLQKKIKIIITIASSRHTHTNNYCALVMLK